MEKRRSFTKLTVVLALVLLMIALPFAQKAWAGGNVTVTRVFQPSSADSYVSSKNQTTNYGTG